MVILATFATIIASQAVISGTFSVAKQAVQLGFLPRLKIHHTSDDGGADLRPGGQLGPVRRRRRRSTLVFRSSNSLGDIYGVAVTGTFILDTLLFLAVARLLWRTPRRKLVPVASLFLTVEIAFFSANIAKVEHGAWLPLVIGLVLALVMINWRRGQSVVTAQADRPGGLARRVPRAASRAATRRSSGCRAWPCSSTRTRTRRRSRCAPRSSTPTRCTRRS